MAMASAVGNIYYRGYQATLARSRSLQRLEHRIIWSFLAMTWAGSLLVDTRSKSAEQDDEIVVGDLSIDLTGV
jgi:hypothetical protein